MEWQWTWPTWHFTSWIHVNTLRWMVVIPSVGVEYCRISNTLWIIAEPQSCNLDVTGIDPHQNSPGNLFWSRCPHESSVPLVHIYIYNIYVCMYVYIYMYTYMCIIWTYSIPLFSTLPQSFSSNEDLAKSLAISCVVTNCGDGLDFRAMGVIFSGLSETGAVKTAVEPAENRRCPGYHKKIVV